MSDFYDDDWADAWQCEYERLMLPAARRLLDDLRATGDQLPLLPSGSAYLAWYATEGAFGETVRTCNSNTCAHYSHDQWCTAVISESEALAVVLRWQRRHRGQSDDYERLIRSWRGVAPWTRPCE